jgi:hypothetical protein
MWVCRILSSICALAIVAHHVRWWRIRSMLPKERWGVFTGICSPAVVSIMVMMVVSWRRRVQVIRWNRMI